MTYAQWEETVRTKVNSSWNLHRLLPRNMTFFILTSSLAGIYGLPSQSNYAAGSSFLDALARMRASNEGYGTTVSLDLGWMESIGIISERADYRRIRERTRDMQPISTDDFIAVLEHYCDPALPQPSPEQSQVLLGTSTPADSLARGDQPPSHLRVPLFSPFFNVVRSPSSTSETQNADKDAAAVAVENFMNATNVNDRTNAVVQLLKHYLVTALGVQPENVDLHRSLADCGVDSLMAIELRNVFWQRMRVSVAVFEILGAGDIQDLGRLVAKRRLES